MEEREKMNKEEDGIERYTGRGDKLNFRQYCQKSKDFL